MAKGIEIVRLVYQNLRQPSETELPLRFVLDKISEVVRKKKLDLVLSEQNAELRKSSWFTVTENDFALNGKGGIHDILLPVRIEARSFGSEVETGVEVPLVNHQVLDTSVVGAAAFYGSPMRLAFRNSSEYVHSQEFRIFYEGDFCCGDGVEEDKPVCLPNYFVDMVASEATELLILLVQKESAEWYNFIDRYMPILTKNNQNWTNPQKKGQWDKYVRMFKGKSRVPKRTFLDNRRANVARTTYYERPIYLNED